MYGNNVPQSPDSPNDKSRRNRTRWFTSTRVIVMVLILAATCLLWTTEWMDRLQIFNNTLPYTGFETKGNLQRPISFVPPEKPDSDQVYNVFTMEETENSSVEEPKGERQSEIDDIPDQNEEAQKEPIQLTVENNELEVKPTSGSPSRLSICVMSSNPRTASLFYTKTLERRGGGKFNYIVTSRSCPAETLKAPITVRMLYQKVITGMSPSAIDVMFSTPENLIIVMGDEFCRCPLDICSSKAHARQYYSEEYVEYATKNPSQEANPTVYLPLGPRVEFRPVDDDEVVASSKRKLLFNLIVSPTSPSRKRLAAMVNKHSKLFSPVFVHVTPAFAGNASEAKGFVTPEEYRKTLLDSKFTLCPAGHNPEAFRLFEASEAGSIPVIVKDEEYLTHACKDSFGPLLASGAPFIVLNSWDELATALHPYQEDAAKLDELQMKLKEWNSKFWREVARNFECSIAHNIERIAQTDSIFKPELYDMPECTSDTEEETQEVPQQVADSQMQGLMTPRPPATLPIKETPTPLIVGCGRTGTLSLSQYLIKAVGVNSVHERMEPNAISVSWLYAVPDAAQYPFEGKKSPIYRRLKAKRMAKLGLPLFSPVVHLVRHPLKVISSSRRCFCGRGTRSTGLGQSSDAKSWEFVDMYIQMPKPKLSYDSLLRSMIYWYEWNRLIEKRHEIAARLRIEDLDPNMLVTALGLTVPPGVELPNRVPRAPGHVSPQTEKDLLPDATWADLYKEDAALARNIFALAQKYGYEQGAKSIEDLIQK